MNIVESATVLEWGALDLPIHGLDRDWFGEAVDPPAFFALALDPRCLWFVAGHAKPATLHPLARPGRFQAELWQYDVAELFLADPRCGRYLEINLAPNGAWWSCEMTAPRVRARAEDRPLDGVATHSELAPDGAWLAAVAIPREPLQEWLDFGPATTANVTFILGSPRQRFLSCADLGPGQPDYHQPGRFPALRRVPPTAGP